MWFGKQKPGGRPQKVYERRVKATLGARWTRIGPNGVHPWSSGGVPAKEGTAGEVDATANSGEAIRKRTGWPNWARVLKDWGAQANPSSARIGLGGVRTQRPTRTGRHEYGADVSHVLGRAKRENQENPRSPASSDKRGHNLDVGRLRQLEGGAPRDELDQRRKKIPGQTWPKRVGSARHGGL